MSEDNNANNTNEQQVGVGTIDPPSPFSLPARSTRGKRLAELVGDELEEDEEFWSSDKWNDEEDDDDFDEGDSDDAEYDAALDDADSDFDKPEEEDEAIIQEEDIVRLQKEEKKKEQRKKGAYVDPALKKRKEANKKGGSLSIRSAAKQASEIVAEGAAAAAKTPTRSRSRSRSRTSEVLSEGAAPTIQLRDSTRNVTAQLEARQEKERELAEKRRKQQQEKKAKAQAEKPPMTQDERLAEAVATEEINKNLLEQMLAVFEEKKQSQQFVRKRTPIGVGVTFVSRIEEGKDGKLGWKNTISFPDELPGVITQKALGNRKRKRAESGGVANNNSNNNNNNNNNNSAPPIKKYEHEMATLNHYMEEISMMIDEKKRKVEELKRK